MAKVRLDALLADRGLFDSRSRAAASVLAGEVSLAGDGRRAEKPGMLVPDDVELAVDHGPRFVSRGGVKLANALDALGIDPAGRSALDVGASTGGFTDALLQRGARRVIALDVAYGELSWNLRTDDRVTVIERTNARHLAPGDLPYAPDLVTLDVSFISLDQGPARGARRAGARSTTSWPWSSRSSRSAASAWARAASCARRPIAARRSSPSPRRRPSSGRPCSASPPPGCPAPRATARRSCGWPRPAGRAPWTSEAAAEEAEPCG